MSDVESLRVEVRGLRQRIAALVKERDEALSRVEVSES